VVYFKAHLVTVNLLFATVKESLKSDSICHYGQMKKGPGFFLIYSVVYCANIYKHYIIKYDHKHSFIY